MAESFPLSRLLAEWRSRGDPYYEFLRQDSLSAGIYHLEPGQSDPQRPHTEDEVYYVLGGSAELEMAGEVQTVRAGDVIFIEKNAAHRFRHYPEGLTLLVVFAPPRGSQANAR